MGLVLGPKNSMPGLDGHPYELYHMAECVLISSMTCVLKKKSLPGSPKVLCGAPPSNQQPAASQTARQPDVTCRNQPASQPDSQPACQPACQPASLPATRPTKSRHLFHYVSANQYFCTTIHLCTNRHLRLYYKSLLLYYRSFMY